MDRSERVGIATLAWRTRANQKFDEMGRGSRSACAKDIKRSRAAITRVLGGGTASTDVVLLVSDWLKIPRPSVPVANEKVVRLMELADELDPARLDVLIGVAEAMGKK